MGARIMHEYSIVGALLDQVEQLARERGAKAVHRLKVRIGECAGVEISLLRTAYETFREGSLCAGAELEIEEVAAAWACSRCGTEVLPGAPLRCPDCGAPARLSRGQEIFLDRVEMEIAHV